MNHTNEQWIAIKDGNPEHRNEAWHIEGCDGDLVTYGHMSEADARRIVACVNACAGLPNDALDGGWTAAGISTYAKQLEQQRDELLAAAKELLSRGPSGHGRLILEADCMNLESVIAKAEAQQ